MARRRRARRHIKSIGGASLLLVWALITHGRAVDFQSSETVWAAAARVNPSSPFTHFRAGIVAYVHQDRRTAQIEFRAGRSALTADGRTFHPRDPLITLLWLWTDLVGS